MRTELHPSKCVHDMQGRWSPHPLPCTLPSPAHSHGRCVPTGRAPSWVHPCQSEHPGLQLLHTGPQGRGVLWTPLCCGTAGHDVMQTCACVMHV
jgi:hypothetical protein